MKIGDIVICVENKSPYANIQLSLGKEYEIINISTHRGTTYFTVCTDNNEEKNFLPWRFELSSRKKDIIDRRKKFINGKN